MTSVCTLQVETINKMKQIYQPLKTSFKPQYGLFSKDEIQSRVDSEDNFTFMKGYQLTVSEDVVDALCPRAKRINKNDKGREEGHTNK